MRPIPWLLPVSWLYAAGVWVRNLLFDTGVFRVYRLGIPVISVGNISAGGTGKTPLVEYLAKRLRGRGKRVAVLSRGYGRVTTGYQVVSNGRQRCADAASAGDEPAQMADNLENVMVVVDENRTRGARMVVSDFSPDVILLDDGFQHRSLAREKDLVVLTAAEILDGFRLLPAGYGREPLSAIARADLLVISGFRNPDEYRQAESKLRKQAPGRVVGMQTIPVGIRRLLTGEPENPELVGHKKSVAFSGIGNPAAFERTVSEYLRAAVKQVVFDDHHRYNAQDLDRLGRIAGEEKAEILLTTQKDGVRLQSLPELAKLDQRCPVYVLEVLVVITDGEAVLNELLEDL